MEYDPYDDYELNEYDYLRLPEMDDELNIFEFDSNDYDDDADDD